MSKRMRGLAISRPILVGSTATPLTPADKLSAPPDHTHRWTVAVRSAASAPLPAVVARGGAPDESATIATRLRDSDMDLHRAVGGADDLSYMIKRVQFRLHETYAQPTRNVDHAPFSVTETGWGEFEIQIKIFFVPEAGEKPLSLTHHLKLHPWQPAAPPPPSDASSTDAPAPRVPPVVHSWQYDEIVFPEPLAPFYDILLAHPPTPWPATAALALAQPDTSSESAAPPDTAARHDVHTPSGQLIGSLSLEAQRAEADRLDLARAHVVQQLDADRARLIEIEAQVREAQAQLAQLEGGASSST